MRSSITGFLSRNESWQTKQRRNDCFRKASCFVEHLEGRRLLSITLVDGLVEVLGSDGDDRFKVSTATNGFTVQVTYATLITETRTFLHSEAPSGIMIWSSDEKYLENDRIYGAGNDRLDVWEFLDVKVKMLGGIGDDTFFGGAGPDTLLGGIGNDTIHGRGGGDTLGWTILGVPQPSDEPDIDYITGGNGDDRIEGGYGGDTIVGGAGRDTIDGARGKDLLYGDLSSDVRYASESAGETGNNDRIFGGGSQVNQSGGDTIVGGLGSDYIDNPNDDQDDGGFSYGDFVSTGIYPGSAEGNDSIIGGHGADHMQGDSDGNSIGGDDEFSGVVEDPPRSDQVIGGPGNDVLLDGPGEGDIITGVEVIPSLWAEVPKPPRRLALIVGVAE